MEKWNGTLVAYTAKSRKISGMQVIEVVSQASGRILTDDEWKQLAVNNSICFPDSNTSNVGNSSKAFNNKNVNSNKQINKLAFVYVRKTIDLMSNTFESYEGDDDVNANNANANANNDDDMIHGPCGTLFTKVDHVDPMLMIKMNWQLIVCYVQGKNTEGSDSTTEKGEDKREIAASCLLHQDRIYGTYEIHEVCVSPQMVGRGICSRFIPMVFQEVASRPDCMEVRIFCETKNAGACRCYGKIPGVIVINTPLTTGYVLQVQKQKQIYANSSQTNKKNATVVKRRRPNSNSNTNFNT